jgi:hypothetical protein
VSKRLGSPYRARRANYWLKVGIPLRCGNARGRGGAVEPMACTACDDTGWVGEEHPARPQRFGGRKRGRSCGARRHAVS